MEGASTTSSATSSVEGGGGRNSNDYLNRGMFANSESAGSLLTGAGFSSLNGFGTAADASTTTAGLATTTSGTTTASFDLNDFPSLGGGNGATTTTGASSTSAIANNSGIAAALREQVIVAAHQQQQQQQQQQQPPQQILQGKQQQQQGGGSGGSNLYMLAMTGSNGSKFNMTSEDFPALGGGGGGGAISAGGLNGASSSLNMSSLLSNSQQHQQQQIPSSTVENGLYNNNNNASNTTTGMEGGTSQSEGNTTLLGGAGLGGFSGGLRTTTTTTSAAATATPTSTTTGGAGNALAGDYGLLGLLGVIRMTDVDRISLALGSDLQMLGLNLGTTEHIFSAFASPWADNAAGSNNGSGPKEPHYQLPMCYFMQPPVLKTGHLSKFQLETLFYIFYALPKDVLQAYAAQELYTREWRYHGERGLWFKRAGPADGVAASAATTAQQQQQPQYLYFEISSWERRLFNGNMNQNITSGFLSEDEVRVKFPNS